MKLPDILTVSRLFLAAILIGLLTLPFPYSKSLALLVFSVAGITDYLDGHLARRVYGESAFGRLMDPLTDKVLICAAFVAFVELKLVPAWIVVVIVSREFLVTGLRLLAATRGEIIAAGRWGKHKTISQIVAILVLLAGLTFREDFGAILAPAHLKFFDAGFPYVAFAMSWMVALISVVSGVIYFYQLCELLTSDVPVKTGAAPTPAPPLIRRQPSSLNH